MRSVNKVILIGNVTRSPESRQTQSGQAVCTFGLATNREWVTSDGRKNQSAEYHEVVAWARLADICEKYVRKGKLLYVEGYLKTRSWDTPEGIRKFKTEVVIQDMIMLEKRGEGEDYVEFDSSAGGGYTDDISADGDDETTDDNLSGSEENASEVENVEVESDETVEETDSENESAEEAPEEEKSEEKSNDIIDADLGL